MRSITTDVALRDIVNKKELEAGIGLRCVSLPLRGQRKNCQWLTYFPFHLTLAT